MSVTVHGEAVVGVCVLILSSSRETTKRSEVGAVSDVNESREARARVSSLEDAMMSDRDDIRRCTRALCGQGAIARVKVLTGAVRVTLFHPLERRMVVRAAEERSRSSHRIQTYI
jgi:hypothetical protein